MREPTWLKPAIDYGPLAVFLGGFYWQGLMAATVALMAATALALAASYVFTRKLAVLPLVTAVVVAVFGGLTVWLDDPTFIKLKPTIIYGLFAAAIGGGLALGRPVLKPMLGHAVAIDDDGWRRLSLRFVFFFLAMAAANEIIRRVASDEIWVLWKVPGSIVLTVAFMVSQAGLVKRHGLSD